MRRLIVVAILAIGILLAMPSTASADSTRWPKAYPNYYNKELIIFQNVSAPVRWRLWRTVENYDRRLGMLHMRVGKCWRNPRAGCVKVYGVNRPNGRWWGRWSGLRRWGGDGRIHLNRGYGIHRTVTCHEVGHALGLRHHRRGPGCLRTDDTRRRVASRMEIRAIRTEYRKYN